ncbi:YidH family protein [Niallia sp. 03133]|uniref:YidH family protein n=1 Tax=Niallia sp. 03133 TaxID=3458060 RepID=UPI004043DEC1
MQDKEKKTSDSSYIQQHLANERTYLAWIRTSIAIIGVGFLITNLHFSTRQTNIEVANVLAETIGLTSIIVGIIIILLSTFSYIEKGKAINLQSFRFPRLLIYILSILTVVIFIVFAVYYLFVWGVLH